MPDQPRKPLATLSSKVPKDVREFVRCRSDSIEIAPQTIDVPNGPSFKVSFEDGGNGSIVILLDGPGDFFDVSIRVSIQGGHLVADTSGIPFGREFVDKWIRDFNADLDAPPAKQLSGISVSNGKFNATKGKVVADAETTSTFVVPPPMRMPPLPDHVVDPIPPPVKVESEEIVTTTESTPDLTDLGSDAISEWDTKGVESGFIERPPISVEASRFKGYKGKVVFGAVGLGVIAIFLFSNLGGDPLTVPPTSPTVATVDPSSVNQGPSSDETTATEESASHSVRETDPAGDNGGEGSGADIVSLEYDGDVGAFVTLEMSDSPLDSSLSWYSYYLEVTFKRASGATQVVIWENHAGSTRSGELDSEGTASGDGVTLTDTEATFQPRADPNDPVVGVCVKAFSLVTSDGVFTQDEMEVELNP
jgi:hypothetical protein